MAQVVQIAECGPYVLAPGVRMYPLFGHGAMLNLVELDPDAVVPLHEHEHEQLGMILEGEMTMTIDGVDHVLRPGHVYQIPGGIEHSARTGSEGCRVLDFFVPVREDYRRLAGG